MVATAQTDRFSPRRDDRVTYILRSPDSHHRFGITSIAHSDEELFTAGRDGTIRAWRLPPVSALVRRRRPPPPPPPPPASASAPASATAAIAPVSAAPDLSNAPTCTRTFDEHVDWVNDILYVSAHHRLISCSSDSTVKVWNASDPTRSLRTLTGHSDYVKALAPVSTGVASASLDSRVLVWDLVTGTLRHRCGVDVEEANTPHGSVYCLASAPTAHVLVSGSTDRSISVWDARTGDRVVTLRGHSDSVRCLGLKHDAMYLLSGGTDSSVMLWDMRQQRCLRTFTCFGSSVWALAPNENFTSFITGARDGSVLHTDIDDDVATLIVPGTDEVDARAGMVLDVAVSKCRSAVWVSNTSSTVRLWPLPPDVCASMGADSETVTAVAEAVSADTPFANGCIPMAKPVTTAVSAAVALDADATRTGEGASAMATTTNPPTLWNAVVSKAVQTQTLPLYVIPGLPGIIAHRVMNDRRHILTCDTVGEYKIWDITRGTLLKLLGVRKGMEIDEVLLEQDTEVSVPSWFQVDIRLGSLLVRLDKATVANAEVYAVDAGLAAATEDIKVNIGEHVILGLFRRWLSKHKQLAAARGNADETAGGAGTVSGRTGITASQRNAAARAAELPQYEFPEHIAVVVTEVASPVPVLRRIVGGFEGNEDGFLPRWVVDWVRDGKGQSREVVKISFSLEPAEGSGLPQLTTITLNAPKVLRVRKVTVYIAKELREVQTGLSFEVESSHLEVLCNGKPLPLMMSLATVRQFRWRSPDDLKLFFRLKAA